MTTKWGELSHGWASLDRTGRQGGRLPPTAVPRADWARVLPRAKPDRAAPPSVAQQSRRRRRVTSTGGAAACLMWFSCKCIVANELLQPASPAVALARTTCPRAPSSLLYPPAVTSKVSVLTASTRGGLRDWAARSTDAEHARNNVGKSFASRLAMSSTCDCGTTCVLQGGVGGWPLACWPWIEAAHRWAENLDLGGGRGDVGRGRPGTLTALGRVMAK